VKKPRTRGRAQLLQCGAGRREIMAGSLRAGESLLRRSHDADRRIHASTLMVSGCRVPGNREQVVPSRSTGRGAARRRVIGPAECDGVTGEGRPSSKVLRPGEEAPPIAPLPVLKSSGQRGGTHPSPGCVLYAVQCKRAFRWGKPPVGPNVSPAADLEIGRGRSCGLVSRRTGSACFIERVMARAMSAGVGTWHGLTSR
jgi:hypothetical protein